MSCLILMTRARRASALLAVLLIAGGLCLPRAHAGIIVTVGDGPLWRHRRAVLVALGKTSDDSRGCKGVHHGARARDEDDPEDQPDASGRACHDADTGAALPCPASGGGPLDDAGLPRAWGCAAVAPEVYRCTVAAEPRVDAAPPEEAVVALGCSGGDPSASWLAGLLAAVGCVFARLRRRA